MMEILNNLGFEWPKLIAESSSSSSSSVLKKYAFGR